MRSMNISWDPTAVNELLRALAEEWPGPVDVFEDDLAGSVGVFRFPTLAIEDWRRVRVRAIESEGSDFVGSELTDPG